MLYRRSDRLIILLHRAPGRNVVVLGGPAGEESQRRRLGCCGVRRDRMAMVAEPGAGRGTPGQATCPNGSSGWTVRDSSFNVTLTEDQTLHGTWGGTAGKPAAAGAAMTFGDYSIKVDRPGRSERGQTIPIHFESGSPIEGDVDGTRHFVCDLAHEEWGPGHARGVVLGDGAVRNVLTFPPGLP